MLLKPTDVTHVGHERSGGGPLGLQGAEEALEEKDVAAMWDRGGDGSAKKFFHMYGAGALFLSDNSILQN